MPTVDGEIVAVMDSQRGMERGDLPPEGRRRAALTGFLGAGMPSPPSTALMVAALAGARRAVAMHQERGLAVDQWLAGEVRPRGIRENAAVLAVLEVKSIRRRTSWWPRMSSGCVRSAQMAAVCGVDSKARAWPATTTGSLSTYTTCGF